VLDGKHTLNSSSGGCPVVDHIGDVSKQCYYHDYLQLDTILSCQKLESVRVGRPAHDEHLFITVHQSHELWFKQIIHELDSVRSIFSEDFVSDENLGRACDRLGRIVLILDSLQSQLTVLESMSPMGFLEFRNLLAPASGFQSVQFRKIENMLGLRKESRITYQGKSYCSYLSKEHAAVVQQEEDFEKTLIALVDRWLSRMPVIVNHGVRFWSLYTDGVSRMMDDEKEAVLGSNMSEQLKREKLAEIENGKKQYLSIFTKESYMQRYKDKKFAVSFSALQAALFISVYKDESVLHVANRLLTYLQEIDSTLVAWRYRHALMVRRMLGIKSGTGGSSGFAYLRATANNHKIFQDLNTSSYLIPRMYIPNRKQIFGI